MTSWSFEIDVRFIISLSANSNTVVSECYVMPYPPLAQHTFHQAPFLTLCCMKNKLVSLSFLKSLVSSVNNIYQYLTNAQN
jgi:hypothetical protein